MSFQQYDYKPSSLEEFPFANMIGKILSGYNETTRSRYLKPTLEEELRKAKLYNQYYAPNIQSEIGLRNAQAGEAGAHAGYLGAQTTGQNIENQWKPSTLAQAIALSKAQEGQYNANTGYLGEQTTGQNITNQYIGPKSIADILLTRSQAGEAGARTGLYSEQANESRAEQRNKIADAIDKESRNRYFQGGNQPLQGINQPNQGGNQPLQGIKQPNQGVNQQELPAYGSPISHPEATELQKSVANNNIKNEPLQESIPQINNGPNDEFGDAPMMTLQDLQNKHWAGEDTFKTRYDNWAKMKMKGMGEKQRAEFQEKYKEQYDVFKDRTAAYHDNPVLSDTLQSINTLEHIIRNRPGFFGHSRSIPLTGKSQDLSDQFIKNSTDPLVGTFTTELIPQLVSTEQKLSVRGNQLALKISADKLPKFNDTQQVALGKILALKRMAINQIQHNRARMEGYIKSRKGKEYMIIDFDVNNKPVWEEVEK